MATRRELMEAEVLRLESEQVKLERDFRRVPFLLVFGLAAIPAYFLWGGLAALYGVLFTPCLVITAFYLVGVRRAENRQNLIEMRQSLERRPER